MKSFFSAFLLTIVLCAATAAPRAFGQSAPSVSQLMVLDPTHSYLIDQRSGKPTFIQGDTAFDMAVQLKDGDVDKYLADRESKGFNLIWMAAVDNAYHGGGKIETDPYGHSPWLDGAVFSRENPAYWSRLDTIVQKCAQHGIVVLLGPAFAGAFDSCTTQGGYCPTMESVSDTTMTAYGRFLGERYKNYPNVIWLLGGDSNVAGQGSALQQKENDLAEGIRSADPVHLMTVEEVNNAGGVPAYTVWGSHSWFGINSIYPKPPGWAPAAASAVAVDEATESYKNSKQPTFSMEDVYDFEGGITREQLRQEGYYEVLSGAKLGRLYGSSAIWTFGAPCCMVKGQNWRDQLRNPDSTDVQVFGNLFRSREHWLMVPDFKHEVVTAGYGSGSNLTVTSRTSDGESVIAYIPAGQMATITVNMSQVSDQHGLARGWWFDPSSGATKDLGTLATSGSRQFTSPDSHDWVLVLDSNDAALPAPGSKPR